MCNTRRDKYLLKYDEIWRNLTVDQEWLSLFPGGYDYRLWKSMNLTKTFWCKNSVNVDIPWYMWTACKQCNHHILTVNTLEA